MIKSQVLYFLGKNSKISCNDVQCALQGGKRLGNKSTTTYKLLFVYEIVPSSCKMDGQQIRQLSPTTETVMHAKLPKFVLFLMLICNKIFMPYPWKRSCLLLIVVSTTIQSTP